MVVGRNDSLGRLPGSWVGAAAALPESLVVRAYMDAALRSGVTPLRGNSLAANRSQHVMGLYSRPEMLSAQRRTLEAIRQGIPSETTRAHFDRIFRPRGRWIIDIHDAALAWARIRMPGLSWEAARRGLTAGNWIPRNDSRTSSETLPGALYRLTVLAATDSAAFAAVKADLWRADSVSAVTVLTLLSGYEESRRWYTEALSFFLSQPWVSNGAGRSIADYVRQAWSSPGKSDFELPEVRTRWFGYPQAVPQYGIPQALFRRLVKNDNQNATEWLERHGEPGLLHTLHQLPPGDTSLRLTLVRRGSETFRLTTVPRQARESLNGFLEPRDAIAIDPGYSPLLALGAVVHEWQHLIFRRRQLQAFAAGYAAVDSPSVELPGIQPHLAEGFAEWSTERILVPLVTRWPLLGLGELEKRAGLALRGSDDPHTMGYALVRALAEELSDPSVTTDLLLKYADQPLGVVTEPLLRRAWGQYRGTPDRNLTTSGHRLLIPEVTFTIEDGFPDIIATRILTPAGGNGKR